MATFQNATASVFYFMTLMVYLYSLFYDAVYVHAEGKKDYIGKFNFLTVWNLCLQTVYFALCSLNALVGSNIPASVSPSRRSRLQRLRDVIHSCLAFPVGSFVVMTFWALYAVDRELVYPRELDKIIPTWLNHVMHTTVLPLLLVDKYLVYHHHPRRHNGIFILCAFSFLYLLWILWIAYSANIWVYPVLRMMQGYERAIFIMFLLMFFISIYLLGEAVTKFLWRKEKAVLLASMKKKQ